MDKQIYNLISKKFKNNNLNKIYKNKYNNNKQKNNNKINNYF